MGDLLLGAGGEGEEASRVSVVTICCYRRGLVATGRKDIFVAALQWDLFGGRPE